MKPGAYDAVCKQVRHKTALPASCPRGRAKMTPSCGAKTGVEAIVRCDPGQRTWYFCNISSRHAFSVSTNRKASSERGRWAGYRRLY